MCEWAECQHHHTTSELFCCRKSRSCCRSVNRHKLLFWTKFSKWSTSEEGGGNCNGSCERTRVVWKQGNSYQIEFTPHSEGTPSAFWRSGLNNPLVLGCLPVEIFVTITLSQLGKPVRSFAVRDPPVFTAFNSSEELLVGTSSIWQNWQEAVLFFIW